MGREAHEDPERRYCGDHGRGRVLLRSGWPAARSSGCCAAFPRALVVAVAGLALLGTIAGALAAALG